MVDCKTKFEDTKGRENSLIQKTDKTMANMKGKTNTEHTTLHLKLKLE